MAEVLAPSLGERPTVARYGVLGFSVVMAVILYLDRMAINVTVPAIATDLNLELSQVGDSLSAFFWCYALFQVPAGWLGDRWGGRKALSLYVIAWSLAIAGLGCVGGLLSLIVMRALLGIAQAGAYATTASFLRRWMPFARRGVANSAVSLGGRAGNVLAPGLTSVLMTLVATIGWSGDRWRPVFFAYALIGFLWAYLFWRWFRDEPRLHAGYNAAEIALIRGHEGVPAERREVATSELQTAPAEAREPPTTRAKDAAGGESPTVGAPPLRAMLKSRDLRALGFINFFINVGWVFVGTWLPTYLIKAHGQDELEAGMVASLAAGAGMAGCLCGGWATDFLARRLGVCWGRRIPGMISYGGAAVAYGACWALDDVHAIVVVLLLASFLGDFALGAMWATFQDIGGALAGTVLGGANMCGNIGAACAISLIGRLIQNNSWSLIFALSACAYLVSALMWFYVDPRKAIRAG